MREVLGSARLDSVRTGVFLLLLACNQPRTAGVEDWSCDRRTGTSANPQPLCEETLETFQGEAIRDACELELGGVPREGTCPGGAIGGCKFNLANSDGSQGIDWFYDVDGDSTSRVAVEARVRTRDQVRAKCNEPGRYPGGATFVEP